MVPAGDLGLPLAWPTRGTVMVDFRYGAVLRPEWASEFEHDEHPSDGSPVFRVHPTVARRAAKAATYNRCPFFDSEAIH